MADALTPSPGTTTTQGLSPYVAPYVGSMLSGAEAVAASPYQYYDGALTAGPSALQTKMFEGLGNLTLPTNFGQSFSSSTAPGLPGITGTGLNTTSAPGVGTGTGGITGLPATGTMGTGTTSTPAPGGIAASYMNPYLSAVLNPQMQSLRENAQTSMNSQLGKLTSQGAYGGGRQAVMQGAGNRDLMQELNKTLGTGYATAYDKGLAQFNKEQDQGKDLYALLGTAGKTQRDIEQEGLTADKREFDKQVDYPKENLRFMKEILGPGSLPIQETETSAAQLGAWAQLLQAAGGASQLTEYLGDLGIDDTVVKGWLSKLGFGGDEPPV